RVFRRKQHDFQSASGCFSPQLESRPWEMRLRPPSLWTFHLKTPGGSAPRLRSPQEFSKTVHPQIAPHSAPLSSYARQSNQSPSAHESLSYIPSFQALHVTQTLRRRRAKPQSKRDLGERSRLRRPNYSSWLRRKYIDPRDFVELVRFHY